MSFYSINAHASILNEVRPDPVFDLNPCSACSRLASKEGVL